MAGLLGQASSQLLMLMIKSNFVTCSTGKSNGFIKLTGTERHPNILGSYPSMREG